MSLCFDIIFNFRDVHCLNFVINIDSVTCSIHTKAGETVFVHGASGGVSMFYFHVLQRLVSIVKVEIFFV